MKKIGSTGTSLISKSGAPTSVGFGSSTRQSLTGLSVPNGEALSVWILSELLKDCLLPALNVSPIAACHNLIAGDAVFDPMQPGENISVCWNSLHDTFHRFVVHQSFGDHPSSSLACETNELVAPE
jgi:hypothetical protein